MVRKHILVRWGLPIFLILLLWAVCAAVGYASSEDAVWPESPGTVVDSNGNMTVDSSHADQGYVMIRVTNPTKNRMKLRVTYGGGQLMHRLYRSSLIVHRHYSHQLGVWSQGFFQCAWFDDAVSTWL